MTIKKDAKSTLKLAAQQNYNAFEDANPILKNDKDFIIECLKDNVSGHILKYVNPYIFLKHLPKII